MCPQMNLQLDWCFAFVQIKLVLSACIVLENNHLLSLFFSVSDVCVHCLLLSKSLSYLSSSLSLSLSLSGFESGDKDSLGSAVVDVLRVVLRRHSPAPQLLSDTTTHSSLVHCGRTKVFLTHAMVCISDAVSYLAV